MGFLPQLWMRTTKRHWSEIPPKNEYLDRKNARIFFRYKPPTEEMPVIALLGGWAMHPGAHLLLINRLSRNGFGVLTMEKRGHWYNEGVGDSTAETYLQDLAEDLYAIVREKSITRIVLSGHSMMGSVSLRFYYLHSDLVAGLVLVAPGYGDLRKISFLKNRPRAYKAAKKLANLATKATVLDKVKKGTLSERQTMWHAMRYAISHSIMLHNGESMEAVDKMLKNVLRANIGPLGLSMQALFLQRDELIEQAHTIAVPTLLIAGGKDFLVLPEAVEELADEIPGSRLLVLPEARHFPMLEFPDIFYDNLTVFASDFF